MTPLEKWSLPLSLTSITELKRPHQVHLVCECTNMCECEVRYNRLPTETRTVPHTHAHWVWRQRGSSPLSNRGRYELWSNSSQQHPAEHEKLIHVSEFSFLQNTFTKTQTCFDWRMPLTAGKKNTVIMWFGHNWWLKKRVKKTRKTEEDITIIVSTNLNFPWLKRWTNLIVIYKIVNTHKNNNACWWTGTILHTRHVRL